MDIKLQTRLTVLAVLTVLCFGQIKAQTTPKFSDSAKTGVVKNAKGEYKVVNSVFRFTPTNLPKLQTVIAKKLYNIESTDLVDAAIKNMQSMGEYFSISDFKDRYNSCPFKERMTYHIEKNGYEPDTYISYTYAIQSVELDKNRREKDIVRNDNGHITYDLLNDRTMTLKDVFNDEALRMLGDTYSPDFDDIMVFLDENTIMLGKPKKHGKIKSMTITKNLRLFTDDFRNRIVERRPELVRKNIGAAQTEPVNFADEMPSFQGGYSAMLEFIEKNMKYPQPALVYHLQGRIFVSFVVETDGSLTGLNVVRGVMAETLEDEAVRIVKSMPKWNPGKINGQPVRTNYEIPVTFAL